MSLAKQAPPRQLPQVSPSKFHQQRSDIDYCTVHGVDVIAWSPRKDVWLLWLLGGSRIDTN